MIYVYAESVDVTDIHHSLVDDVIKVLTEVLHPMVRETHEEGFDPMESSVTIVARFKQPLDAKGVEAVVALLKKTPIDGELLPVRIA